MKSGLLSTHPPYRPFWLRPGRGTGVVVFFASETLRVTSPKHFPIFSFYD